MTITQFQKLVWDFYALNGRELPWRKNINPYRILVSEVMLQQTQVSRVVPKYRLFLKLFPNFKALAKASSSDILKAWSGLGYNRRGLYLKRAAEMVHRDYHDRMPKHIEELVKLPGVGKNTAGAILAYAFNEPVVFIETNIRRVFIHHFFKNTKNIQDADLLPIIAKTVKSDNRTFTGIREWYWALMDYGSFLASTIENPNRRSKHYSKQSKFEGSVRQLRGAVLRVLISVKSMSISELEKQLHDERLPEVLEQLIEEGFVVLRHNQVEIKN